MNKNIYEETTIHMEKILADRDTEMARVNEKIESNRKSAESAAAEMDKATNAGDLKGYQTAKAKRENALDAIEMYTNRRNTLKGSTLVSAEENAAVVASLQARQKELVDEATVKIIELVKQIERIGNETYSEVDRGNEILMKWHTKVYKQMKKIGMNDEKPIFQDDDPRYQDTGLRHYINSISTENYAYNKLAGHPIEATRTNEKVWLK